MNALSRKLRQTKLEPLHLAKARSLLKASPADTGLCINFHASSLANQIKRISQQSKGVTLHETPKF
jgi:hypothetical protein